MPPRSSVARNLKKIAFLWDFRSIWLVALPHPHCTGNYANVLNDRGIASNKNLLNHMGKALTMIINPKGEVSSK